MPSGLKASDIKIVRKVAIDNKNELASATLMKQSLSIEHKNLEAKPQLFEVEVLNIPNELTEEDAKRFFL